MKTVRSAAQILTMFSAETPKVTVSAAVNRFGLSPSAASRLLASLATSGIIQRGPDRAYSPGPLAYRLGLLYHAHNRLADLVNDGARKIVATTGRSCWVSVLSGMSCMLISRFPGPLDQGFHLDAGRPLPANASAGGKALLARLPDADLHKLVKSTKLDAWTPKSKTDVTALLSDLELVRQRGWSLIVEELLADMISIAVAFSAPLETAPMALSISISSGGLDEVASNVAALTTVANEIGGRIGDPFWMNRSPSQNHDEILDQINIYSDLALTRGN